MIVLNEIKEAERIINEKDIGEKPYDTVSLLIRYYYHNGQLREQALKAKINDFMYENYQDYNSVKWEETIQRIIEKAEGLPLVNISSIPVTEKELDIIDHAGTMRLRRLAFTLLCLAKYCNIRNSNNNNWVYLPHKDIFLMADIRTTTEQQALMLNDLKEAGLISFSCKVDNINIRVDFIDNKTNPVINVKDFREIGKEYMIYKKPKLFSHCKRCGRLFKKRGSHHYFCPECSAVRRYERSLHKNYIKKDCVLNTLKKQ